MTNFLDKPLNSIGLGLILGGLIGQVLNFSLSASFIGLALILFTNIKKK